MIFSVLVIKYIADKWQVVIYSYNFETVFLLFLLKKRRRTFVMVNNDKIFVKIYFLVFIVVFIVKIFPVSMKLIFEKNKV